MWGKQLPFAVEMESRGVGVMSAASVLADLPETTLRFRVPQVGTTEVSFLTIPRPLLLVVLGGLLGEPLPEKQADVAVPPELNRELTPVEDSIVDLVVEQFFLDPLQQTWPFLSKLRLDRPQRAPIRSSPPYSPDTLLLVVRFVVRGPFGEIDWTWMLPKSKWLESLEIPGRARTTRNTEPALPPPSREERESMVCELPVQLTVHLGSTKVSLLHLAALQVGDVLLLDQAIDQPLSAALGKKVKFLVWPGARGSRQAIAIHAPVESSP
jgi:flagellar motor switch protein FliM